MTIKPWREVAHPHKDVLEGTFKQSEFAADISQVHSGQATPEYQSWRAEQITGFLNDAVDQNATDHSTIVTNQRHAERAADQTRVPRVRTH